MPTKSNLELKHFCPDFKVIRKILRDIGVTKDSIRKQKDYFFYLPTYSGNIQPRLKLRIEGRSQMLVYYQRPDFQDNKSTTADVELYTVNNKQLLPFLIKTLGVQAIIEKKRELWKKKNIIFNLDEIDKIGKVFEIELQKKGKITKNDRDIFQQYQNRFRPYLGKVIKGSNLDLVLNS